MSDGSADDIRALLERAATAPHAAEERALLDEAIALADAADELELAYHARLALTGSANLAGDTETMLASFAWTVGMHDRDPGRFPLRIGDDDLLFQYKWMAPRLMANPGFPISEIDAIHADMSERYRAAGASPSAVYQSRFFTALQRGDLAAAARYQAERDLAPRDEYSHCEACSRNEDALFARLSGDPERAIVLYDEIIDGGLSCGAEPETSEAEALVPYLRAGRFDDARRAHLRSYRTLRGDHGLDTAAISDHLIFCAVTGNEARGLAMLERHIGMLTADPLDLSARLNALIATALVLDAVSRAGHPDTVVRGTGNDALAAVLGAHDGEWTAEELATVAWAESDQLAAQFDVRNGTTARSDTVQRARALGRERFELPIDSDSFRSRALLPTGPVRITVTDWLTAAREAMSVGALEAASEARNTAESLDDGSHDIPLLGLAAQIVLTDERTPDDGADEIIAKRGAALRAVGRASRADAEASFGSILFGRGQESDLPRLRSALHLAAERNADPETLVDLRMVIAEIELRDSTVTDATLESLELALELASDTPDPVENSASATFLSAHALIASNRFDDALVLVDRLVDDRSLPRYIRVPALRLRMQLRLASEDPQRGLADAEELMTTTIAIGHRDAIIDTSRICAQLLAECGRPKEAAARVQFALAQLPPGEHAVRLALLVDIGRYQENSCAHDVAAETLEDAYRACDAAGADASVRSEILWWWGEASAGAGDPSFAAHLWDGAIHAANEAEEPFLAAQAGISLGQLLASHAERTSIEVLTEAMLAAEAADHPQQRLAALHRRAQAKAAFGDATALDDLDEVLAFAEDNAAEWLAADVEDSRARALESLGRRDEAIPVALTAADRFLSVGDIGSAAMAELCAARILAGSDRDDEAVAIYRSVVDHLPRNTDAADGVGLEFAALLDRLGRTSEATWVRSGSPTPVEDVDGRSASDLDDTGGTHDPDDSSGADARR